MNPDVTVREVMDREYVGVSESDDLVETVELLLREDAEVALVVRGSRPVGTVSERDVLELLVDGTDLRSATVEDAMTDTVPTIAPDETLPGAAEHMSSRSTHRLVVAEGDGSEPLGVVTEHDLLTTTTYGAGEGPPGPDTPEGVTDSAGTAVGMEARTEAEDSYEDQGICERCGTLTRDLTSFNGQLLCADCRDV